MHTSPSAAHVTTLRSSEKGMNCAWSTLLLCPVWNDRVGTASTQFHSTTVRSSAPERSNLPSALKLIVLTQPLCFRSLFCILRDCTKSCAQSNWSQPALVLSETQKTHSCSNTKPI